MSTFCTLPEQRSSYLRHMRKWNLKTYVKRPFLHRRPVTRHLERTLSMSVFIDRCRGIGNPEKKQKKKKAKRLNLFQQSNPLTARRCAVTGAAARAAGPAVEAP